MDSRNHARMVTSRTYGTLRIECDFPPFNTGLPFRLASWPRGTVWLLVKSCQRDC